MSFDRSLFSAASGFGALAFADAADSVLWILFDFAPFLYLRPSAPDLFFFGSMIRLVVAVAVAAVGVGVCNEIIVI